ncbi:hypothetical protein RX331_24795 [Bradyrhizobium sp. BWA-3-5]|nr:hypothetical protein [Bradyrhizobium sp. BWA-3-5]WOH63877.1 hypothetical protein RX331_24795 [Bradyrhizobium sp. BWA-3-5]
MGKFSDNRAKGAPGALDPPSCCRGSYAYGGNHRDGTKQGRRDRDLTGGAFFIDDRKAGTTNPAKLPLEFAKFVVWAAARTT